MIRYEGVFGVLLMVLGGCAATAVQQDTAASAGTSAEAHPGSREGVEGVEPLTIAAPSNEVDVRSETVISDSAVPQAPDELSCDASGDASLAIVSTDAYVTREQVSYRVGKAEILKRSWGILDAVATRMCLDPMVMVEVGVHTDSRGSAAFNKRISQLRAEAVRDYLTAKGVPKQQIRAVGYGESRPLTHQPLAKQRRTEFLLVDK